MTVFKCLFCLESLKDRELVCKTSCDHYIHEWCIEEMKKMTEHHCKICHQIIIVHSQFEEFDLAKCIIIESLPKLLEKIDVMIKVLASRENTISELTKLHHELSDKVEGLAIEHHALKFEKKEMENRLKKIENDKI